MADTWILSSKLKEQLLYLPRKFRSLTNLQRVGSLRIVHATQTGHRLGQKPQLGPFHTPCWGILSRRREAIWRDGSLARRGWRSDRHFLERTQSSALLETAERHT